MAKSYRTCYYKRKDLWSKGRPCSWEPANKFYKTMCHQIERAMARREILRELRDL